MARSFNATYYYSKKHLNFNVPTRGEWELHKLLSNKNRTHIDVILSMPVNDVILGNASKCWSIINDPTYENIICSISGGADSDIVLDLTRRCDPNRKIFYFFVDTGLESKWTKEHLDYLQLKYQVKIHRFKAKIPIPLAIKQGGNPFVSKQASEFLMRLQKFNFEFEDWPLEDLCEKYCIRASDEDEKAFDNHEKAKGKYVKVGEHYYRGCYSALQWWTNTKSDTGENSRFNIGYNKWLKEFLIKYKHYFVKDENGNTPFKVANKCCKITKKDTIHEIVKMLDPQLNIQGVRKAEGGARAGAYQNCYDGRYGSGEGYRPIFWFLNKDKEDYDKWCDIHHSRLYDYLKRTGCSGCPFGGNCDNERACFTKIEPQMAKAMDYVFGKSYELTNLYHDFVNKMNQREKTEKQIQKLQQAEFSQMTIFDFVN